MKRPDTPWARFANQFRRQRLPSNVDEDDGKLEWEMDDAAKSETAKVHEAWDRTRELVTRGNAAGAVASLTLFGSQQLGDRDPHLSVFLTLCLFITSLGVLLLRQLVVIWHLHCQRKEKILAVVDAWDAFNPPPFIMNLARIMDWISIILMITGIFFGLYVLFGLTSLKG